MTVREQARSQVLRTLTDDGVELHVEVSGERGPDILFLHEFSGDHRSWDAQVEFLRRRYRCIVFGARGFPPSQVPAELDMYSQSRFAADAISVLDAVESERAHLVGMSMGAFTALNTAIEYPDRVVSATAISCGYGADTDPDIFRAEMEEMAATIRGKGCAHLADLTGDSPYRLALRQKDAASFERWKAMLAEHDAVGQSNTLLGVQRDRPTLLDLCGRLGKSQVPLLFVAGDEDDPVLAANLAAKQASPRAGLLVLPRTAHTINHEEPGALSQALLEFITWVDAGSWPVRDPRSSAAAGGWIR
jgi:pimeloyl-ACP methyl ester carboxylesterase